MNGGGFLFCIFLLACIELCISLEQRSPSLDYGHICQYTSSLGCPIHDSVSWRCTKLLTNCSGDQLNRYHCVLNSTGEHFKDEHRCAPLLKCVKGTLPIYDKRKEVISCEPCRNGYYQPSDVWSDETPECLQKHKCEQEGHKIECDMGTGLSNTQDVLCRCDARNNYILINFESRGKCVEWAHATCYLHPCPDGQERLLNYSCASLCPQGQKRDDNDICVLIGIVNKTAAPIINNMTMSVTGKVTPPPTVTTTLTLTSEQSTRDNNMMSVIASAVIIPVILLVILIIICWKCKLFEKCWSVRKQRSRRRHSLTDAGEQTELEVIIPDANPNGTAQRDTCQEMTNDANPNDTAQRDTCQEMTNDANPNGTAQRDTCQEVMTNRGTPVVHHHHHHHEKKFYVKADIAQFGDNSRIKSFKIPAEQPKTHEDSSSSSSRHSSDLQLADSLHLQNSSQGELPVDRNSSEDIESDTQPKQTSNGTDSSERHASSEETYRKVVE